MMVEVYSRRGFTLVEMLIALFLLGLVSILIVEAVRFGRRAYAQSLQATRASAEIVAAQRFLRRSLESAYPFDASAQDAALSLEGSESRLAYTAPIVSGAAGHQRFEVLVVPAGQSGERRDIVVRSRVDRGGAAPAANEPSIEEVLLTGIHRLELEYVPWPDEHTPEPAWVRSWTQRAVPALIRVNVFFPPGDKRQWPELIVAPRVTHDANCRFDVVAQDCRDES